MSTSAVTINSTTYTAIAQSGDIGVVSNPNSSPVYIVFSDTQPTNNTAGHVLYAENRAEFRLTGQACWAKLTGDLQTSGAVNITTADPTTEPGNYHFAITPSNSTDLENVPRCLYIGTGGDITIHDAAGTAVTYKNVSGLLPFRARRVLATGITAEDVVGMY